MSLVDADAQNASLAMSYGPDAGSLAPSSLDVELWVGDPVAGGVELSATGGYAAVTVPNDVTTWPDAPDGGSITSAPVEFAASSDAWADSPTHFLLRDHDTGVAWDSQELSEAVAVAGAGVVVSVALTVYYNSVS